MRNPEEIFLSEKNTAEKSICVKAGTHNYYQSLAMII
jgi:hypothetical protein